MAVQRLKEREREEQRAIRERIREQRALEKEREEAEEEERKWKQALEPARQDYDTAKLQDRAKYQANMNELEEKLRAAEEKSRAAKSMAQQTKRGCVYVVSNIGSFGEHVFKIGLTRRLEPLERIRELGGASVPFVFDVHALIDSDDAPALETALHRRFLQNQVNKVNPRKEFFRLNLREIRDVIGEMKLDAQWTMAAEARDYRDTLIIERKMKEDPILRKQWEEQQATYEVHSTLDEEDRGYDVEYDVDAPRDRPMAG